MGKIFSTLFILILLATVAFSQKKATATRRQDFTGTWVLEKTINRFDSGKKLFDQTLLFIAFKDSDFKITKVFVNGKQAATYTISLLTDKSGETNNYTGFDGDINRTSKRTGKKTLWSVNINSRSTRKILRSAEPKDIGFPKTDSSYLLKLFKLTRQFRLFCRIRSKPVGFIGEKKKYRNFLTKKRKEI